MRLAVSSVTRLSNAALYVEDPANSAEPQVVHVQYVTTPEGAAATSDDNRRSVLTRFQQAFFEPVVKPVQSWGSQVAPASASMPETFQRGHVQPLDESSAAAWPELEQLPAAQSTPNPESVPEGVPGDTSSGGSIDSFSAELPPIDSSLCADANAIDLVTTLRLAGASNVQLALARERVCEANARFKMAKAMWLPSLNAGIGYNNHSGRIQDTRGRVIEASRSSIFVGGGAAVSGAPLTGGSGGPARLFVDLSLSDALFDPLAAQQRVRAVTAARDATFSDVLMNAAVTYLELLRAQGQRAIAEETVKHAEELVRLTEAQERANIGLPADVQRARAELSFRQRQVLSAEESTGVASANLARLLRLDPCCTLCSADERPVPIDMVDPAAQLCDLIAQGIACRPERSEALAFVRESITRRRQETMRPWLPNIHVGYSGGGFAGGESSFIGNFGSRGDVDVLAVWQLRNMGVGTQAPRDGAASRHRQAHLAEVGVRDQIGAEVSAAYHQAKARYQQIEVTRRQVEAAATALPLNFRGILGRQLRAIEAQQAIESLNAAWNEHLDAIVGYDQAQFLLLRAIGRPASSEVVAQQAMDAVEIEASVETPAAGLVDYVDEY